jgi:hypothetical protein
LFVNYTGGSKWAPVEDLNLGLNIQTFSGKQPHYDLNGWEGA